MEFSDLFSFDKLVTPALIRIQYWLGLVIVLFIALGIMFSGNIFGALIYGGSSVTMGSFIVAIVVGAFLALGWRLLCELCLMAYSINERLGVLAGAPKPTASAEQAAPLPA